MSFADELRATAAAAAGGGTVTSDDPALTPPPMPPGQPNLVPGGQMDLAAQLRTMAAGQPIASAAPESPGGFNQRAGSLATGANDVIAQTLGAPFDFSTWLGNQGVRGINAVAGTEIPQAGPSPIGSEFWRRQFENTVGRTEPKDDLDRLLYGTGGGIGGVATGLGIGGALRAAGRAPAVANMLIGGDTLPAQAGNLALGGIGGFGGALGEQAAGEDPAARALGNVVGSVGLPLSVVGLGTAGYNYARNRIAPAVSRSGAETGAARQIQGGVGSRLDALRNFDDTELVPGSRPTLGQATADPGLVRTEGELVGRLPAYEDMTSTQRALIDLPAQQQQARAGAISSIGDPNAQPSAILPTVKSRLADLDAERERVLLQTRGKAEGEFAGLGPRQEIEVRGGGATRQMTEALAAHNKRETELWQAIDPSGKGTLDLSPAAKAAGDIEATIPSSAKPRGAEETAIFDLSKNAGVMPFTEVQGLRNRLLTEIRTERDANGQSPALHRMGELRKALDDTIDTQAASPQAGTDADMLQRFRVATAHTSEQKDIWGNRVVDPLIAKESGGRVTFDTAVPGKVLENFETAQMAMRAGVSPDMLRGALVDDLSRHAGADVLTQAKLDTWLKNREGALRAVPGLRQQLERAADANTRVEALQAAQTVEREAVEKGAIGKILKVENPADLPGTIGRVLNGGTATGDMMKLRGLVKGDAAAEAGLVRGVADYVAERFINAATGDVKREPFLRWLNQKEGALRAAGVSPEGIDLLKATAKDLERPAAGQSPSAGANRVTGSPNVLAGIIRNTKTVLGGAGAAAGPAAATTGFGAGVTAAMAGDIPLTGGVGLVTGVAGGLIDRYLARAGQRRVDQVLAEAFKNPAYGRALLLKDVPENAKMIEPAMRAALFAEGSRASVAYGYEQAGGRKRKE